MPGTTLRDWTRTRLDEIGWADVLVGIPTFNHERSVAQVIRTVGEGLARHFGGRPVMIAVCDGGSTDYTREVAKKAKLPRGVDRVVTIYYGGQGKGTAVRSILESAEQLNARACVVLDPDVVSITPDWVHAVASPVLEGGYDFVAPYYLRHKHDATITNSLARALTRAVFGRRLRQPMGGEYGLSPRLIKALLAADVWTSDVARYGVDIWATIFAICEGMRVCETALGTKSGAPVYPIANLGPAFRQVCATLFDLMERYETTWRAVNRSREIPLVGTPTRAEPVGGELDVASLAERFSDAHQHVGPMWESIVGRDRHAELTRLAHLKPEELQFPPDLWAHVVYDFALAWHRWKSDRARLPELLAPIHYARLAAFVNATRDLSAADADRLVDAQAERFEELRPYFVERWSQAG